MSMTIASLALALLTTTASEATDTTVSVAPGSRLEVNTFAGEIVVHTWNRNAVRVQAEHPSRVRIEVDASDPTVVVRAKERRGLTNVDYRITVPAWMPLDLSGVSTEISVDGSKAEIKASTVNGDVTVVGGSQYISLSTVEGEVNLSGARGRMEVSSVNQGVRVKDSVGDVMAETVNGDIRLDVDADHVEASTVNGSVVYDGPYKDGGAYNFSTHNGDVTLGMNEKSNVAVSVATFSGEFSSSFPLKISDNRRGKRFSFTLGTGKARVELESFQGTINIRRPGEAVVKDGKKHPHKDADSDSEDEGSSPDDEGEDSGSGEK